MKTTILFAFALLLNCSALFAQSKNTVGVILSPTAAKFRDSPDYFPSAWMPAFSMGFAFRNQAKDAFFFQTELSYERKGLNWKDVEFTDFNADPIGKATISNQFDYLTLTPLVGFVTRGKVHFEGSFGLFCGYLVRTKSFFSIKPSNLPSEIQQPNPNDFNRLDIGTTARAGIGFSLKEKWSITINAIGNLGFMKPYKPSLGASPEFGKDKTVAVGLQLGLFYKI